jgi:hypothetical protein
MFASSNEALQKKTIESKKDFIEIKNLLLPLQIPLPPLHPLSRVIGSRFQSFAEPKHPKESRARNWMFSCWISRDQLKTKSELALSLLLTVRLHQFLLSSEIIQIDLVFFSTS